MIFWSFKMIEIKDDYLDRELFLQIRDDILDSQNTPWFLQENVSGNGVESYPYFTHLLFSDNNRNSNKFNFVATPIAFILGAHSLIRMKINLYPRTETLYHYKDHIDYQFPHKAAILYLNTNNGYTVIGDQKIESVENRLLRFDATVPHHSTTCTDAPYRSNININYF